MFYLIEHDTLHNYKCWWQHVSCAIKIMIF